MKLKTSQLVGLGLVAMSATIAGSGAALVPRATVGGAIGNVGRTPIPLPVPIPITVPPRIPPVQVCPSPTFDTCSHFSSMTADCQATNKDACTKVLHDRLADITSSSPAPAIMPTGMKHGDLLLTAGLIPPDSEVVTPVGVSSALTYATVIGTDPHAAISGAGARHAAWTTDGTRVADCTEYVYKRYWDYERFREAAEACRSDFECIYQVAISAEAGIDKPALRMNDRGADGVSAPSLMSVQVRPFVTAPGAPAPGTHVLQEKNAWFKVNPVYFAPYMVGYATNDEVNAIAAQAAIATQYDITDRLAWHKQMHDQQQPLAMTAAEHANIDKREKAFRVLIDAYLDLKQSLESSGNGGIVADIMHPTQRDCSGHVLHTPLPGEDPSDTQTTNCKPSTTPAYPSGSLGALFAEIVPMVAHALVDEWRHKSIKDGVTVDHGCLDASLNRCDWQPKMMTEYLGLFQGQKQTDFDRCVTVTANDFPNSAPPMGPSDTNDLDSVERYFASAVSARMADTADLPARDDHMIGVKKGDEDHRGDSGLLYGHYKYGIDWKMYLGAHTDPGGTCNPWSDIDAYAEADVSVLGIPINVIDAELHLWAGKDGTPDGNVQSHLRVLGKSYYDDGAGETVASFHYAPVPIHFGDAYKQTVWVPIPVTLTLKWALDAGLDVKPYMTVPQECLLEGTTGASMGATVRPWATATVGASGAIGVEAFGLGAEAGVEGDVTLIDVAVPLNVDLTFSEKALYPPSTRLFPALTLSSSLDLQMTFLKGDIKAYAEVCYIVDCSRAEKVIKSWNGIDYHGSLVSPVPEKVYPLQSVATRMGGSVAGHQTYAP